MAWRDKAVFLFSALLAFLLLDLGRTGLVLDLSPLGLLENLWSCPNKSSFSSIFWIRPSLNLARWFSELLMQS